MAVGNLNKITLTEGDIAGASLKGNNISQMTIPELKRWLSYRKEAKLIERSLVERYEVFNTQCIQ